MDDYIHAPDTVCPKSCLLLSPVLLGFCSMMPPYLRPLSVAVLPCPFAYLRQCVAQHSHVTQAIRARKNIVGMTVKLEHNVEVEQPAQAQAQAQQT